MYIASIIGLDASVIKSLSVLRCEKRLSFKVLLDIARAGEEIIAIISKY